MTGSSGAAALYTPEILQLAVELADYPPLSAPQFSAEARSPICGSVVEFSAVLGGNGAVESFGLRVAACAIGQAAAAIFARHAMGADMAVLSKTEAEMERWLEQGGVLPEWPDIRLIEKAREYPGRRGAIILPWKAACLALSKGEHSL